MAAKIFSTLLPWLFLLSITLLFLYTSFLPLYSPKSPKGPKPSFPKPHHHHTSPPCNFTRGRWIQDPHHTPIYDGSCPFHRNAWNCLRNQRENMETINSWKWVPENCDSPRIDPVRFLGLMRNRRIGFVGDSLNENFLVSFLCILRAADGGASKWKRKGAWRGGYFPKFNVTVAYHRAVLLARHEWVVLLLDLLVKLGFCELGFSSLRWFWNGVVWFLSILLNLGSVCEEHFQGKNKNGFRERIIFLLFCANILWDESIVHDFCGGHIWT